MSSLQSLETPRGIRSCCSQVNRVALRKQRDAFCLSCAGTLLLFALLRARDRGLSGSGNLNGLVEQESWWVSQESWGLWKNCAQSCWLPGTA